MAHGTIARGTGGSARLDAVGMTVTRTPFTLRSITSAALPVPSCAWNRRGELQRGEHLVGRRFPLGVEDACREHPAIHLAAARSSGFE